MDAWFTQLKTGSEL